MVLYAFLEISKTVIGGTKNTVCFSFSCPVSHLSEIFEAYFKVFYGVLEIFKVEAGVANIATSFFLLCPLPMFIGNLIGVSKITGGLFLVFLSHSTNELQMKSTAFPEDSCSCHNFLLALLF